jgi:hypothetical protein
MARPQVSFRAAEDETRFIATGLGTGKVVMARFNKNRHMTLILALAACLAASSAFGASIEASRTDTGGDPAFPPPASSGDPDLPVGPSKSARSQMPRGYAFSEIRSTGDERSLNDAWVWRLRVVLRSLKAYYIRF